MLTCRQTPRFHYQLICYVLVKNISYVEHQIFLNPPEIHPNFRSYAHLFCTSWIPVVSPLCDHIRNSSQVLFLYGDIFICLHLSPPVHLVSPLYVHIIKRLYSAYTRPLLKVGFSHSHESLFSILTYLTASKRLCSACPLPYLNVSRSSDSSPSFIPKYPSWTSTHMLNCPACTCPRRFSLHWSH